MLCREKVEKEYLELYDSDKLGLTVWSPLCSGILTGKYNDGIPQGSRFTHENTFGIVDSLKEKQGYFSMKEYAMNYNKFGKWDDVVNKCKGLKKVADKLGCTQAQLALAWVLKNKNVSVIILGASKITQLEDNIKCLNVLPKLTDEIMNEIEKILDNTPVPEPGFK